MRYPRNSWAILPAAQVLFGKNKVDLNDIATQWSEGSVVVCVKENGQFHFIAGASGSYSEIGKCHDVHHDQTLARIGNWLVVNEIRYKKVDGELELEFAVPPVYAKSATGNTKANMTVKAGLHVFK